MSLSVGKVSISAGIPRYKVIAVDIKFVNMPRPHMELQHRPHPSSLGSYKLRYPLLIRAFKGLSFTVC